MAANAHDHARHYDTIVIGAGMSGLACASRLLQNSYFREKNRLLVLEARDRIGGRIGSVSVNGNRLDTGANWIHGIGTREKPNPLMGVLPHKRYRQLSGTVAFRPPDCIQRGMGNETGQDDEWLDVAAEKFVHQPPSSDGGSLVVPSDVAEPLMGSFWGMIGSLHELAQTTSATEAKRTTILQAIHKTGVLQEAFEQLPKTFHQTLGGIPQFIEGLEAAPLVAQSAEHSYDQSGVSLLEYAIEDFDGDQVFLRDGYLAIIDEFAKPLVESGLVECGTEVEQINWNSDLNILETGHGTYIAKRVVCTLPLGLLKHRLKTEQSEIAPLFKPDLPLEKVEAITSLGFGTLDKIFLVYSKPWWTEEPYASRYRDGIVRRPSGSETDDVDFQHNESTAPDSFMGFTDELAGIKINRDGTTSPGPRVLSFINLHNLTGFPVLATFVSCANAVQIESLSDSQAAAILHRALTKWLGIEPPTPDAVHVTRWAQDPHSRGSYSHVITGLSETRHREAFQTPVIAKDGAELRFAGEHTSRNHFATVHGALLSGWREADGILNSI